MIANQLRKKQMKEYDPLRVLIHPKEFQAYQEGKRMGIEYGMGKAGVMFLKKVEALQKRIKDVRKLESTHSSIQFLGKQTKHDAYIAGLEDAIKIFKAVSDE